MVDTVKEQGLDVRHADVDPKHITRRRDPTTGWPRVNAKDYQVFSDAVCKACGMDDYVGLTMCEPGVRATVSTVPLTQMSDLLTLFKRWYPKILDRLMSVASVKNLRVEVNSKMGGPIYARDPKKHEILRDVFFPQFLQGDFSSVKDAYTIINVRLQQEKKDKIRVMPVISSDGVVYDVEIKDALRQSPLASHCFSARARNVYNPNVTNNYKQVVDNAIHDAIMSFEPFHHDMYSLHDKGFRFNGYVRAIDVKHFERCVGALVQVRADVIGQNYSFVQRGILEQSYLCIADDWKSKFFVKPKSGFVAQLASGDSAVAPLGKETLIALYAAYFFEIWGKDEDEAVDLALKGGDRTRVAFFNYGDDNVLYGDKKKDIDALVVFLSQYLTVEDEDPPAFLGWEYSNKEGFFLRDKSAIVNFWKPERPPGPPFRPFFYLGFYLRWKTYRRYGSENVQWLEQEMWEQMELFGITEQYMRDWTEYEIKASGAGSLPLNYVTGKNYLLTDEEKDMLGQSKSIGIDISRRIFKNLVNPKFNVN